MTSLQKSIYIENFPLETSSHVLKNLFSSFGEVNQIDMPTFPPGHILNADRKNLISKGFALIEFKRLEDASRACEFFSDIGLIREILTRSTDSDSNQTADKIYRLIQDTNCKQILSCTVIPKYLYIELNKQYQQQRFQSLTRAAKMLVIS